MLTLERLLDPSRDPHCPHLYWNPSYLYFGCGRYSKAGPKPCDGKTCHPGCPHVSSRSFGNNGIPCGRPSNKTSPRAGPMKTSAAAAGSLIRRWCRLSIVA